jgi:hypothetical protein
MSLGRKGRKAPSSPFKKKSQRKKKKRKAKGNELSIKRASTSTSALHFAACSSSAHSPNFLSHSRTHTAPLSPLTPAPTTTRTAHFVRVFSFTYYTHHFRVAVSFSTHFILYCGGLADASEWGGSSSTSQSSRYPNKLRTRPSLVSRSRTYAARLRRVAPVEFKIRQRLVLSCRDATRHAK